MARLFSLGGLFKSPNRWYSWIMVDALSVSFAAPANPAGPFCPLGTPRFVCDEMLKKLGQWLRVAGYDTVFPAPGTKDRDVLSLAVEEGRWLVTRDRDFNDFSWGRSWILFIRGGNWLDSARDLTGLIGLDWHYRPFTRCKSCNQVLEPFDRNSQGYLLPGNLTSPPATAWVCPSCRQAFWEGSHVYRMRRQLTVLEGFRDW